MTNGSTNSNVIANGSTGEGDTKTTATPTWDLTSSISPHLDLHMMFPLLEYVDGLIGNGLIPYSNADVAQARLSLLRPTHMVDYAMDIYRELHGEEVDIPKEMEEQKAAVFEKLEELRAGCKEFEELITNDAERGRLFDAGKWNIAGLASSSIDGLSEDKIELYRQLAKFNYDCGDYQSCLAMLDTYLSLFVSSGATSGGEDNSTAEEGDGRFGPNKTVTEADETNEDQAGNPKIYNVATGTIVKNPPLLEILWGKLSCEILLESWEAAGIALDAVKTALEKLVTSAAIKPLDALVQRTWLLHWGLFVFWNNNSVSSHHGLENMVELFTTEKYLQAITTNAPHLLRYLTAAVLLIKRRKASAASMKTSGRDSSRLMRDLVKIMQHCDYTDPIVEFVDCLCVKFDFEKAQTKLTECEKVLETDFFLCRQTALFMEEARVFVFENYCRIHHKIDLAALGEKLAMDPSLAERWIVDLIRNALLDAKIDSEEKCVVMGANSECIYEQVMDRTRDLNLRSSALTQNLQNALNEARKEKSRRARTVADEAY